MERLGLAVLLVLMDGVPAVVHVEEPPGRPVRRSPQPASRTSSSRHQPRDAHTAKDLAVNPVPVLFRPGSPGVLDIRLNRALMDVPGTNMGTEDGAEFALQMLRFRQVSATRRSSARRPSTTCSSPP
jgi:hypothetical protein